MVQTIVTVLILLSGAILAGANASALQHVSVTLSIPGQPAAATAPLLTALACIGGAFVLVWLAGEADRQILLAAIRQGDRALRAAAEEVLGVKAASYDRQQASLNDIRMRLDSMAQDLRNLLGRSGAPHFTKTLAGRD